MRVLYFDCSCGAGGDMIVAALVDAGVPFESLRKALLSLRVHGFDVSVTKVNKRGMMAARFFVNMHEGHAHPHRRLEDILEIIERGELPEEVKRASGTTFRRIAECEARIHGTAVDEIHFHEIGAVDSIADIVGAHFALHDLRVQRVVSSPLNLGSGTVRTAHGIMPVPAPATAALLSGVPSYGSEVDGELVTPTGAAIITGCATSFGPMPQMSIQAVGYGSGARDLPDRANVLRVIVGETIDTLPETEPITVIEANIDDMNPELLPPLIADLLAKGALDAFLTPILGKKGRPAYLITVLCDEAKLPELMPPLFYGSTTFGVRFRTDLRICLERVWKKAKTPWGDVRVKVGRFKGQITCLSPEFEDCRRVAIEQGVPVLAVYEWAHAAAVKGDLQDA